MDHRNLFGIAAIILSSAAFLHSLNTASAFPQGPNISMGGNPIESMAGNGSTTLLTVPSDRALIITDVDLTNSSSGGHTVSLTDSSGTVYGKWYVPQYHYTAQVITSKISGISIPPGTQLQWDGSTSVNYTLSGYYANP